MPSTPYMKLYIGDYLGDTSHLSALEHGAYLLLIMAYWQKGGCIRNADAFLMRCTRTTPAEWKSCKSAVLEFFEDRDGYLYHKRIEKELHKRVEISSKCKKAANDRWSERNANAMQTHSVRNATPIDPYSIVHNSIQKEKEKDSKRGRTTGQNRDNVPKVGGHPGFESFWNLYPKKVSKGQAEKTYGAMMRRGIQPDSILSCLRNYIDDIQRTGRETQYIKNPSTFLNNYLDYEKPAAAAARPTVVVFQTRPKCECGGEFNPGGFCTKCGREIS